MGNRYWFWVVVRLGVGVAIVACAASYLGPGGGEKEFQKTLDAMKQVRSLKGAPSGLEHDTICLGLQDHLPYELTVDWEHARSSYSDYNSPIQFDVPESVLEPASASNGSN